MSLVAKHETNGKVEINLPGYRIREKGHARQISMAAEAINKSEAAGALRRRRRHQRQRRRRASSARRKANMPVTMTLLGLGSYDRDRPESLDMLGMHGSAYANYAVQECDLLIAVGARFDDRVTGKVATFAPHAKVIHIDVDPSSISKNVHVDIPVVGDAKAHSRSSWSRRSSIGTGPSGSPRSPNGRRSTRSATTARRRRSSRST